jgi:serine protease inhibitor
MGMEFAFDHRKADFTGIAIPRGPNQRLRLEDVHHKAFVRVDEKGTEATAATAVTVILTSEHRRARGRSSVPVLHPGQRERPHPLHGSRGDPTRP